MDLFVSTVWYSQVTPNELMSPISTRVVDLEISLYSLHNN